jgi:hypothetical protein
MRKSKQLHYEAVQVVPAPASPPPVGTDPRLTTQPARADRAVRELVRAEIGRFLHKGSPVVMVEEMEVCLGRARVDLAVISDQLIGIEIKSVKDDVTRLPAQAEAYSRCFDRVVLVVDESLVAKATPLIPAWWGLVVSFQQDVRLTYVFERRPRRNPQLDLDALLALLWREEVDALLGDLLGISAQPRATKKSIRAQLLAEIDPPVLHCASLNKLRGRTDWRGVPIHT